MYSGTRTDMFIKSVDKNWYYILTYIIGVTAISIQYGNSSSHLSNVMNGIITLLNSIYVGWSVHYVSHNINLVNMYQGSSFRKYIKDKYELLDWSLFRLCKIIDFHDTEHHDTTINKRWINIITEFIQNIVMVSVTFIVLNHICNLNFNNTIILSYGIIYAITHNILYSDGSSITHTQHHTDKYTNYGLDFMDIIMGTKYDNTIELYNDDILLVASVYASLYAVLGLGRWMNVVL